jgi:hypothetical protein
MNPDADADFPDDHHKEWRDYKWGNGGKPDPIDDGWHLVLWMAVMLILIGLLW